ncbi:MAG TPA: hypothetical protein VMU66_10470 [Gaiellales bacterium]|nr:hypothetical protein [Gaiellales bacterium]
MSVPELSALVAGRRTLAVIGLAKNCGKTTVVNHLLERLEGPVGLASLGLDGERTDHLTGLPKPRVKPPRGALVATADDLPAAGRVCLRTGIGTAVGEVVVVQADGSRAIVVSGPARLGELDQLVEQLRRLGARTVLLEGALGRLGPAAPGRAEGVVVAAGAAAARDASELEQTLVLGLDALAPPVSDEPAAIAIEHAAGYERELVDRIAAAAPGPVEVAGAVTGQLLEQLLRAGVRARLIAPDATHLLASPRQLARAWRAGVTTAVRAPLAVLAVTSSPFHPDHAIGADRAFAAAVRAAAGRWPVHDVVSGRMAA